MVLSRSPASLVIGICALCSVWAIGTGCYSLPPTEGLADWPVPRELSKVTLPPYVIEPPDLLLIESVRTVPEAPYRIEPLDTLTIRAVNVLPDQPIGVDETGQIRIYVVDEQGLVDLGPAYGKAEVAGLTVQEAQSAIEQHLKEVLEEEELAVAVELAPAGARQQIFGEHLVRPDGTVNLGIYGRIRVAGMTLEEAEKAIEEHLSEHLEAPDIFVDVIAYNSKVCYVIFDGGGFGEQIVRLPITGNETVLDAIGAVGGLPGAASQQSEIWVARPAPPEQHGTDQILPVDWVAITQGASIATNYQLFPGDRLYVKADHWIAMDGLVSKVVSPIERMFGFVLLGTQAQRDIRFIHLPPVRFR